MWASIVSTANNTHIMQLQEQYQRCEPPPNFHRVTPLREDGKDAMKLYTDPNYFLNLWIEGENKDYEQRKKRQRDRREKRKKRDGSKAISGPKRKAHTGLDKEFEEDHVKKQQSAPSASIQEEPPADAFSELPTSQENGIPTNPSSAAKISHSHSSPAPPPPHPPDHAPPITHNATIDVTPQASYPSQNESITSQASEAGLSHRHPQRLAPLAPPPPTSLPPQPPGAFRALTHPPPADPINSSEASPYHQPPPQPPREPSPPPANIPAPPPNLPGVSDDLPPSPPPPADSDLQPGIASLGDMDAIKKGLKTVERTVVVDPITDLMSSIKKGTKLRKVEKKEEAVATQSYAGNDVASILSRRIAIELSDSDSDYDDDYSDDEDWVA